MLFRSVSQSRYVEAGGKNTKWKVYEFDENIGASNGKETRFMRVECSQGVIHGHPIDRSEFLKLSRR